MAFKKLENNRPFAKIAFEGFAGDGKSYTTTLIAMGIHKMIKSEKPIAIFDTEKAFKALVPVFASNGIEAVVDDENRSLESLFQAIKWCEEGNADILIIDSITHVYEEFINAYMKQKNRTRLEFQDWGVIKPMWKEKFSTPFVKANVHILFTGRAGYEYTQEVNEQTGKKEITKSGIKMKAENETAFEPDILVLMEKEQKVLGKKKSIVRLATILKDRTTKIDGKTFNNPTFKDFYPAISLLLSGTVKENSGGVIPDTFDDWEKQWSKMTRDKSKTISEIEACFNLMGLGTSGEDKKLKTGTLNLIFGVLSVDKLEDIKLDRLEIGLSQLRQCADSYDEYLNECTVSESKRDLTEVGNRFKAIVNNNQLNLDNQPV